MKLITMVVIITALWSISSYGQSFQNLDFESAYGLPGNPGNGELVPVANALPGWTAYYGALNDPTSLSSITYASNNVPNTSTLVYLEGGSLALSGNNLSVELFQTASISQTGLVPNNAMSLQFESAVLPSDIDLSVTLGGQSLSYSEISEGSDYYVYAANIPAYLDGQTEALIFHAAGPAYTVLDNIEFMPAPEPSEYALLGLGIILFGLHRHRKRVCAMRNTL